MNRRRWTRGRQPLHARLYDLDLQLGDMTEAGVDLSSLAGLLEWNASTDECQLINNDLAKVQVAYPRRLSDCLKLRY